MKLSLALSIDDLKALIIKSLQDEYHSDWEINDIKFVVTDKTDYRGDSYGHALDHAEVTYNRVEL